MGTALIVLCWIAGVLLFGFVVTVVVINWCLKHAEQRGDIPPAYKAETSDRAQPHDGDHGRPSNPGE